MIGKTLGHYAVSTLLGKGGMGEVYRAKDQKLGRDVAIKVLPEEFAKDADRVARFQREAKLLASLNHPNIAAIYGLEESDGTHFLVLELIEGDTLADRLKHGAIPVEESLKLGLQIAEALEAAHEKGVIHRDLKPANIKVTPDGKVKVLDFGLAKAFAGDQGEMNLSNSPTLSAAATQQGIILGTAAYMSPEQASGEAVDKRTDIWAFGVVLFEMLTGHSLFEANNVSQTLASVIKSEPEWNSLPPNLHPRIRLLLERCLEKETKNRCSGIGDARVEIQKVLADPSGVFAQTVTAAKTRKKLRLGIPWVAAAAILCVIIGGAAIWYLKPSEPHRVNRFDYHLPEDQGFDIWGGRQSVTVSADGTKIVYAADKQLYLKESNEFTAKPIQGTNEDPKNPFFSPDGQWIGYFDISNKQLKKISVNGGTPMTVCEVNDPYGATWGTDDRILFGNRGGIMRVSAKGGTPETIVKGGNELYLHPQMLPDGMSVLFTVQTAGGLQVAVQSLESGERNYLFPGGPAQYLSTGHLVYASENNLMAIPFDIDTLEVSGGSFPMVESVYRLSTSLPTHSAISESGTLVYLPGTTLLTDETIINELVWVDRNGKQQSLSAESKLYYSPVMSPDGTKVAMTIHDDSKSDIWIRDITRNILTRLTLNESSHYPLWTPDGQRIVFWLSGENKTGVYWKSADGSGEDEFLAFVPDQTTLPFAWSVDGKTLVTVDYPKGGSSANIGSLSMEGDHPHKSLLQEEYNELSPHISPDGKWIAYTSDESGESQVYVRPFPDVDKERSQVSTSGGSDPLWSPDGRELYYISNYYYPEFMAVAVETEPKFRCKTPEALFQGAYIFPILDFRGWDISPDGKQFLLRKYPSDSSETKAQVIPNKINIVVNWFEELKKRVPME